MFKIFNVNVYGIREALIRATYPMQTMVNQDMSIDRRSIDDLIDLGSRLGHSPMSHGDDKFLRQIIVTFDVLAPRYWWQQFDTYGFTVKNSQSSMHKAKSFDFDLHADSHVDEIILSLFKSYVHQYVLNPSEENLLKMKANMPEGICLAAGISTNYAQLKTIYYQRKNHRLPQWKEFCSWICSLPYAEKLGVVNGNN